jgi:tetratricopeptide (TPR) repeat protein
MAHQHIVYMMMADSAVQAGEVDAIQRNATKLEELALQDDHLPYLAVAWRALGVSHRLVGETVEAVDRLNKALEIFVKLEAGWQIGRTYHELGEVARSVSEVGRAGEYFNHALSAFESMNAIPDIERTRAALGALN